MASGTPMPRPYVRACGVPHITSFSACLTSADIDTITSLEPPGTTWHEPGMLRLTTPDARYGRRDFLRIGSLALGGWSLPQLCPSPAMAAAASRLVTGKSVIFLFLHGGPSQIETFDPKMTAPLGIRSATGEIATKIPGVTF